MNTNFSKNSHELFNLINALSAAEQRHLLIKLQESQKSSTSVAIAIYKSLQKLKDYNKVRYLKKLNKEINNEEQYQRLLERLPNEEVKLQDKIRRFLRDSSSAHYQHVQIKEMLTDVRLLMERGLAIQAHRLIDQIREKAVAVGDTMALLEINREERTVVNAIFTRNSPELTNTLNRLIEERKSLIKQLEQEFDYQDVYDLLTTNFDNIRSNRLDLLPDAVKSKLPDILGSDKPQKESLSLFAEMRKRQSRVVMEYLSPDEKTAYHAESIMKWWHEYPLFLKDQLPRYFVSFTLYVSTSVSQIKNDEQLQQIIRLLQSVLYKLPIRDYIEFRSINVILFPAYLNARKLDTALLLIKDLDEGLQKFIIPSSSKTILRYSMAVAHFVDGNFREAAHRFHQLKRANYTGVSPQNRYAVELLELICLFEVSSSVNQSEEEPTDLKYKWKKANGLFEQWMDDSHVYRKALTHFYTVAFSNLTEQKHSLKQWKSDIEKYKDNKEYRGIDEQLTWIESRLTRLPIRKVFFAYV